MEDKIRDLVKEMFDSGMTLDAILETISRIAESEDFKRFVNETR